MQGLGSNSALFWAPEKAVGRQPLLIFSLRLKLGPLENAGVPLQFHLHLEAVSIDVVHAPSLLAA